MSNNPYGYNPNGYEPPFPPAEFVGSYTTHGHDYNDTSVNIARIATALESIADSLKIEKPATRVNDVKEYFAHRLFADIDRNFASPSEIVKNKEEEDKA